MVATVVSENIDSWSTGKYIFNHTADAGHDPGPVRIPAQDYAYKIKVHWGGYDKSDGEPSGDIFLLIGANEEVPTQNKQYRPQDGDDDKTWRWDRKEELVIPAGQAKKFSVSHRTTNSSAGNTYLRIEFIASD